MNRSSRRALSWITLLLLTVSSVSLANGLGYQGWGPRVGISADPDQLFGGVHFDLGEIVEHLRLQPNVEIGFGDDVTSVTGSVAVHWLYEVDWPGWQPYSGGEVGLNYLDFDGRRGSDTEFALNAVGGVETRLKSDNRLSFEIKLGIIEEPDVKLLVGWTF